MKGGCPTFRWTASLASFYGWVYFLNDVHDDLDNLHVTVTVILAVKRLFAYRRLHRGGDFTSWIQLDCCAQWLDGCKITDWFHGNWNAITRCPSWIYLGGQSHWQTGLSPILVGSLVSQVTAWAMDGLLTSLPDPFCTLLFQTTDLTKRKTLGGSARIPMPPLLENSESQTETLFHRKLSVLSSVPRLPLQFVEDAMAIVPSSWNSSPRPKKGLVMPPLWSQWEDKMVIAISGRERSNPPTSWFSLKEESLMIRFPVAPSTTIPPPNFVAWQLLMVISELPCWTKIPVGKRVLSTTSPLRVWSRQSR